MFFTSSMAIVVVLANLQAYHPQTGELVDDADCEKYHSEINDYRDEMLNPSNKESRASEIRELAEEAQEKGCSPDPIWAVSAGSRPSFLNNTQNEHQFVPASESEAGVPHNFDFTGWLTGLFGAFPGTVDSIYPAVRDVVTGSSDSSEQ